MTGVSLALSLLAALLPFSPDPTVMQDPVDKTQLVLDRLESLARELGAVGADTAGVLVESYGRSAMAAVIVDVLIFGTMALLALSAIGAGILRYRRVKEWDDGSFAPTLAGCFLILFVCAVGGSELSDSLPKALAPEWHLVQELIR